MKRWLMIWLVGCMVTALAPARARAAGPVAPASGPETAAVLDFKQTTWRYRCIRGTVEYLTAPDKVEKVVYRPKKPEGFRTKIAMDPDDYTVEPAMEYVLPAGTPADWMAKDFDDSQWVRNSGPPNIKIPWDANYAYADEGWKCMLARGRFEVLDPAACDGLMASVAYRGGVTVYLNGVEIGRQHVMPGRVGVDTLGEVYPEAAYLGANGRLLSYPAAEKSGVWTRKLDNIRIPADRLVKGSNVLAVAAYRSPLPKACLLRGLSAGAAGRHFGWNTVGLEDVSLTAPRGAAVTTIAPVLAGNAGAPAKAMGLTAWNVNALQNVSVNDAGDVLTPLQPVRAVAARNAVAIAQLAVGMSNSIKGLRVTASDLQGPAGIPASAVQVRYPAAPPDGERRWRVSFDTLAETPPAEVPVNKATGLAVQPLWFTITIPTDAKPGEYSGTLTISADGQPAVSAHLVLRVSAWTLPALADLATFMDVMESPDSLAMRYDVPMWSDAHLKLLDREFALLAPVATRTLYITAIRRTHMGNEHAIVQWTRGSEGQLEPDLSNVEKYLDVAIRRLGKNTSVVLYAWEPPSSMGHWGGGPTHYHDRLALLTLKNTKTGKLRAIVGPDWGTPESTELWGKLVGGMKKLLADRGMSESLLFGLIGDHRPTKQAMDDIANAAPQTQWAIHTHIVTAKWQGYKMGLCAGVWGIGCNPALPEFSPSGYGWRSDFRLLLNTRFNMGNYSSLGVMASMPEQWLGAYAGAKPGTINPSDGTKGVGRIGADFWPVLKDTRGNFAARICGRYPETAWGQLSLEYCLYALLAPGPEGPISTLRAEAMREGIQQMEARILIERALLDKDAAAKLGEDLTIRCRQALDNRRRAAFYGRDFFVGSDWTARAELLYSLADEVGRKTGLKPGKPTSQPGK